MSAYEITHVLKAAQVISQQCTPTRLITDLLLADETKFLELLQDSRNVILVVEVTRVDADQTLAIRLLARRDLGRNA